MAGLLTLVISFLARLVGLGRVSDAVTNIINRIRAPIDRALDRVVAWIVNLGRRFMTAARSAAGRVAEWWRQRKPFRTAGGESHEVYFVGDERNPRPMVASRDPQPVETRLERFLAAANASGAPARKRNAIPLIGATRTAVRANADDPIVVTNLRTLFGIFGRPINAARHSLPAAHPLARRRYGRCRHEHRLAQRRLAPQPPRHSATLRRAKHADEQARNRPRRIQPRQIHSAATCLTNTSAASGTPPTSSRLPATPTAATCIQPKAASSAGSMCRPTGCSTR